jgi:hypothetical protein
MGLAAASATPLKPVENHHIGRNRHDEDGRSAPRQSAASKKSKNEDLPACFREISATIRPQSTEPVIFKIAIRNSCL